MSDKSKERVFEAPAHVDAFYRDPQCRWKHRRNCDCKGDARKPIKLGSGT